MKCCSCGGEIRDDARFCPLCGAVQPELAAEPAVVPAEPVVVPAQEVVAEPAFIPAEPVAAPVAEPEVIPAYEPAPAVEPAPQPKYEYVPQPEPVAVKESAPQPQTIYQTVYQSNTPVSYAPGYQLPDKRGLLKMIFLGLITFGIYNIVIMSRIAEEINMVASKRDGKRTQQFFWAIILTYLTLGIYAFVWIHGLCNRIGDEVKRRGINYKFGATDFWIWNVLVGFLCALALVIAVAVLSGTSGGMGVIVLVYVLGLVVTAVGPCVYTYKLCKATNLMNRDYNING